MSNDNLWTVRQYSNDGTFIDRPPTVEEIALAEADTQEYRDYLKQRLAEAEAKATQKAALLERLGISEDEARLLLA